MKWVNTKEGGLDHMQRMENTHFQNCLGNINQMIITDPGTLNILFVSEERINSLMSRNNSIKSPFSYVNAVIVHLYY